MLRRHPIFPVLVFIVLAQVIRDNYPFTHYSMYSRPTSEPISYYYIADGNGQPLKLMWHTGLTSSRLAKYVGFKKGKFQKDKSLTEPEILSKATAEALAYVRSQNRKRKSRPLPDSMQLVQVTVSVDSGEAGFSETKKVVAEVKP